MGIDRTEQTRRRISSGKKTAHPYAAIEHRVIDSIAFASLTPSAVVVLLLITRQLTKTNNGRLQATYSYTSRHGIGSEHTLSRAIADLIAHGMIYRTRSGGYQNGAAQYAVTWLPITRRDGLYCDGFQMCAWRDWVPEERNNSDPKEMQVPHSKNGTRPRPATALYAVGSPPKNADNELMPCSAAG